MTLTLKYERMENGLQNRLLITGARVGPHRADITSYPSGMGLGHVSWGHDHPCELLVPSEHEKIVVNVDPDAEDASEHRLTVADGYASPIVHDNEPTLSVEGAAVAPPAPLPPSPEPVEESEEPTDVDDPHPVDLEEHEDSIDPEPAERVEKPAKAAKKGK